MTVLVSLIERVLNVYIAERVGFAQKASFEDFGALMGGVIPGSGPSSTYIRSISWVSDDELQKEIP